MKNKIFDNLKIGDSVILTATNEKGSVCDVVGLLRPDPNSCTRLAILKKKNGKIFKETACHAYYESFWSASNGELRCFESGSTKLYEPN